MVDLWIIYGEFMMDLWWIYEGFMEDLWRTQGKRKISLEVRSHWFNCV